MSAPDRDPLRRPWRPLLIAVTFLTRVPVPPLGRIGERETGASLVAYPVVGLLLGAVLLIVAAMTQPLPALLQASLIVGAWVALTGALHIDGLADTTDAWIGGAGSRERTLEIMKDPACGPVGVAAVVVMLLVKTAAVAALLETAWLAVPLAVVLGRCAVVALFVTTPYVRAGGLGAALAEYAPRKPAAVVAALVAAGAVALAGWPGAGGFALAAAALIAVQHASARRLGGTTGDVAGASVEITETAALLGAAIVAVAMS